MSNRKWFLNLKHNFTLGLILNKNIVSLSFFKIIMFEIKAIEIVGFIAAILTTSAFVPQVYRAWKTKDVEAISLTMFIVMFTGVLLWLTYGFYLNSLSMVLANIITSLLILTIIILKIKHKKH